MQNDVILLKLDDSIDESRLIKKGEIIIEAFDYMGKFWPLYPGKHYKADLDVQQLDYDEPEIIYRTSGKVEQINNTFAYYLYGYVEDGNFIIGDYIFDFTEHDEKHQYNGKYIKFKADRVNVTFLEEIPVENNHL